MTMQTCNELCMRSRRCKFFAVTNAQQCLHATSCGGFDVLDSSKMETVNDNPGGIYQMYCTVKVHVSDDVGAVYDDIISDAHVSAIGEDDDCPTRKIPPPLPTLPCRRCCSRCLHSCFSCRIPPPFPPSSPPTRLPFRPLRRRL
jgi:hypothetical protein